MEDPGAISERYLDLLKKSLLNELYFETEARILYIIMCQANRRPIDQLTYTSIRHTEHYAAIEEARRTGGGIQPVLLHGDNTSQALSPGATRFLFEHAHTMMGRMRLDSLHRCLDAVRSEAIAGDLVETGVWRGGGTIFMRGYLEAHRMTDRLVWVADSFEGLPRPSLAQDAGVDLSKDLAPFLAVPLEDVKDLFARYDLLDEQVRFLKGWFRDTLPAAPIDRIAILRLDGDLYESTMDGLSALYERVSPGGFVIVDDFNALIQCRQATDDFRRSHAIDAELHVIDDVAVYWRKP